MTDAETLEILYQDVMGSVDGDERLLHLATVKAMILAEREACAKIAADTALFTDHSDKASMAYEIEAAIRARSET